MKYIVTGATSGLGRNLAKKLSYDGHHVIGLGRRFRETKSLSREAIEYHQIDLENMEAMAHVMQGADAVFHCAALSSPWGKYEDFYKANVVGTENVIKAMEKSKTNFLVHVSTPSIYFDYKSQYNISENYPLPKKLVNHYATTKKMAEDRVMYACDKQKIKATIIRPRAIIGPHDRNILPRLLQISKKGYIPLINEGKALIDITYVDNVIDAMLLTLKSGPHQNGKIYNITNGEPILLQELMAMTFNELEIQVSYKPIPYFVINILADTMEKICKILPSQPEPHLTKYSVGVFALSQTLNIEAAQRDLNYVPLIPIREGIKRAAYWWKQKCR
jgi:nucleoside-diphosphate-sugar epimerase